MLEGFENRISFEEASFAVLFGKMRKLADTYTQAYTIIIRDVGENSYNLPVYTREVRHKILFLRLDSQIYATEQGLESSAAHPSYLYFLKSDSWLGCASKGGEAQSAKL
jgi:hypothetical protein